MKQRDYKKEYEAYKEMARMELENNPNVSKKEVNAKARDMYIKDAEAATKSALDKLKLKNYIATAPRTNLKTGGPVLNPSRMRNR